MMCYLFKMVTAGSAWKTSFAVASSLLLSFTVAAQECVDVIYLKTDAIAPGGQIIHRASSRIFSQGVSFKIESGGMATLEAGERIELHPGFKALNGARLLALPKKCDPVFPDVTRELQSVVYPNPTQGVLNINSPYRIQAVRLLDLYGLAAVVQSNIENKIFSIDTSGLTDGFYILEIISGNTTERIRVEKR